MHSAFLFIKQNQPIKMGGNAYPPRPVGEQLRFPCEAKQSRRIDCKVLFTFVLEA